MRFQIATKVIAVSLLSTLACAAFAHISLQDTIAATGSSYRATFRVGHGCEGASTTGIQVILPAGFNGAQPMPKAGWKVSTRTGTLAQPYEAHGKKFTEGVLEIHWTAQAAENALPDAFYDEFVLRGTTPKKAGPLWFKVIQTCEKGSQEWMEVPTSGTSTKGLKAPAVLLELTDTPASAAHQH